MHGYGKYVFADGKRYEGQYVDDKKHGYGIYQWPDGRLYKGYWKNGKQHGLAEYQTMKLDKDGQPKDLKSRFGQWKDGERVKWFSVDKKESLTDQLKSIEEQVITESEIPSGELRFYAFRSPAQFYEGFAQALVEAQRVTQELQLLLCNGISKQSTSSQHRRRQSTQKKTA